jgi:imidazoleglycerol-phosphate dehydratase/histidinol-phosphatase
LAKIATELDYELVMVTNQDGLGRIVFQDTFWPTHKFHLEAEVYYSTIFFDRSFQKIMRHKTRTGHVDKIY